MAATWAMPPGPLVRGLTLLLLVSLSCGFKQQLFACGSNSNGQLGLGDTGNHFFMTQLTVLSAPWAPNSVTGVSSGDYHSIILANNQLYTTGYSTTGQLGRADASIGVQYNTPVAIGNADAPWGPTAKISLAVAGAQHNMVLAGNQVYGFGDNSFGQLGLGTSITTYMTAQVLNGTNAPWGTLPVTALSAGRLHSLILAGGFVYRTGSLGTATSNSPVVTPTPWGQTSVTAITSGSQHAFVIAGGQLYVMGVGMYGQLGLGPNTRFTTDSPLQVAGPWGNATVTLAAGGSYHSIAVAGGWLYAFGSNGLGQLGLPNVSQATTPTLLNYTGLPWCAGCIAAVAAGVAHNVLLTIDGLLYVWGDNSFGQLGLGGKKQYNTPTLLVNIYWLPGTISGLSAKSTRTFVIADPLPLPSPSPQSPDPSPSPSSAWLRSPSVLLSLLLIGAASCWIW